MKLVTVCLLTHTWALSLRSAVSEVQDSQDKHRIQTWLDWKNQGRRYDLHFNPLPGRLTPENEKYAEGLYMRGLGFYVLALAYAVSLAVYLLLRLRFKVWGGQSVKNEYFTSTRRYAPGLLCGLGFFVFLSGGAVLLTGSHQAHSSIQTGVKATVDTALLTCAVLQQMKQTLITTNMQHFTDQPQFYISTNFLSQPTDEALQIAEQTKQLRKYTDVWESRRLALTLVLFCLGFVLFVLALLGFVLKVESMLFCFSVSMSVLGVLATVLYGLYVAEIVGTADYCEAVLSCVYDSVVPKENQGLGVFYRDFSSTSRMALLQGEQALHLVHSRAVSELSTRQHFLFSQDRLPSVSDNTSQEWTRTIQVLSEAISVASMQDLEHYQGSRQVTQYCREVETEVCGSVMDELYLGFVGLVIVSTGFSLAVCGGFAAPRVIERWRREEQQQDLGKYNFYGT